VKFAWIATEKAVVKISELCRAPDVSPSGYYARGRRPESANAQRDRQLRVLVRASFEASKHRYGSPRIHEDLLEHEERHGDPCNTPDNGPNHGSDSVATCVAMACSR